MYALAQRFFSAIITLVVMVAAVQAATIEAPMPTPMGGDIDLTISAPALGTTRLDFGYPEITTQNVKVDDENFVSTRIPGESFTSQIGYPELPMVNRVIGIPDRGEMRIRVVSAEYTDIPGVRVYPMQPWEEENQDNRNRPFTLEREAYRSSEWYPSEIASLSEPAIMRDVRLAIVSTFPVQYNAATNTMRVYSNIQVVVEPTGNPGTNEKTHHNTYVSSAFMPLYRQLSNFDELGLDEAQRLPGQVVIVCANDATVLGYVNPLAEWKRRRGTQVRVATLNETGTSASQIKNWVQNFYNSADPPLEYLILVGDATTTQPYGIPAFSSTDHDYALMDGGDNLPDIAVGRLSVNSGGELDVVTHKCIKYERDPFIGLTHWYKRGYLLAGYSHETFSNITTKEWVKARMYEHGFDDVDMDTHSGHINATQMRQQVGVGCTFFNWRGGWIGEMSTTDLNGLENGWMLPQVVTITCGTGSFSGTGACVTEAWLRYGSYNAGNGGITCIGTATSGTHVQFNNIIDAGYYYGYFVEDQPQAGMAMLTAKFQLYRNYWPWESSYVTNYLDWVNLMGDPELKTWMDVPEQVNVSHANTIATGCNQIEVTVTNASHQPVEGILVTAVGNITYERVYTNENGVAVIQLNEINPGTIYITTWGDNYQPYEGEVTITQQNLWVGLQSITIDDDNLGGTSGNNDGNLNPEEIADITVTLHNYGSTQTATSVVGVLSSIDQGTAQVLTSTQNFPNIAPGANGTSTGDFRIQVQEVDDQDMVRLLLEVTASGNDQTSLIDLAVNSGDLEYLNHTFAGGGLAPGETEGLTVGVTNMGHLNITNCVGHLFSESNFVSFPNPTGQFGTITMGSNVTNSANPFIVTANSMTFPGTRVKLGLAFQGDDGFTDTSYFHIDVGTANSHDPTGPDHYGYYAFDDTDTEYEMCPTYEWIEIDPNLSGPGINMYLSDNGEGQDDSDTLYMPFEFKLYGHSSNILTVCTNGWVALGDQRQFTNFRNWHLPGPMGPNLFICPFWDELKTGSGRVCKYYDAVNGWYIVEWSNVTSFSGIPETFQVLLYDPNVWPTFTGDGMIKYQYHTISNTTASHYNDNDYATIGIENDTQDDGLELTYWNTYTPGTATLQNGRAYFITNMVSFQVGALEGTVTDDETGNPVVGARVEMDNGAYDTTDAVGYYFIPEILVNDYGLICTKLGYNDETAIVTILEDDTITQDFSLLHPEFELSITGITNVLAQGDTSQHGFVLTNDGNGELTYDIDMDFHLYDSYAGSHGGMETLEPRRGPIDPPSGTDDPWDELLNFNVTSVTDDPLIRGAAFAWGSFWVVGGGISPVDDNMIYQFDPMGNLINTITQPTNSVYGFNDLAFDGEYLWGSENQFIVAFDTTGTAQDSIPGQLNPNRCLSYDPAEDVFYTGDITADIIVIDREGNEIRRYENDLAVWGLAWFRDDPDDYQLYLFCQEGSGVEIQVQKLDINTGDIRYVTDLNGDAYDRAGGAMVSPSWNPLFYTLVGQIMGSTHDKVAIWEIGPNTAWITYTPTSGTVPGGGQQVFDVLLDAREMLIGEYGVNLVFNHNAISQSDTLPVRLTVSNVGTEPEDSPIPFTYSLGQNYPNPFNPITVIPYSIQNRVHVSLDVYNVLGQRVARLVDGVMDPGEYKSTLNVHSLASGIYFYQLKAGTFNKTRKMVILK
jgi:hypothetical protein